MVEAVTGLIVLGAMPPMGGMTRQAWATHVWTALASEKATRPTAVWISAALAPPDRMSLLYRILQRFYTSELPVLMEMPQMHAADETEHSPS